jgi:hypothetical protein
MSIHLTRELLLDSPRSLHRQATCFSFHVLSFLRNYNLGGYRSQLRELGGRSGHRRLSFGEALAAAISADILFLHERGWWMVRMYVIFLSAGGTLGALCSGFIINALGWR